MIVNEEAQAHLLDDVISELNAEAFAAELATCDDLLAEQDAAAAAAPWPWTTDDEADAALEQHTNAAAILPIRRSRSR